MPVYTDPITALRLAQASRAEDVRRAAQYRLARRSGDREAGARRPARTAALTAAVVRWVHHHAARPAAA